MLVIQENAIKTDEESEYHIIKKIGCYDAEKKILKISFANGQHLTLSKRELDILKLLMFGCTAKKIGQELNISFRTAEQYIEQLKDKFACDSKSDLIIKAIKNGFAFLLFE